MTQTIPEAIVGYRIFQIYSETEEGSRPVSANRNTDVFEEDLVLGGLFMHALWEPGLNTATCLGNNSGFGWGPGYRVDYRCSDEEVPHSGCNCGYQAYFRLGERVIINPFFFEEKAIAAVLGGGRAQIHQDGWRAEKAMVLGLLWNPNHATETGARRQKKLAEKYRVPLFKQRGDLEEMAQSSALSVSGFKEIPGVNLGREASGRASLGAVHEIRNGGALEEIDLLNKFSSNAPIPTTLSDLGYGYERNESGKLAVKEMEKDLGQLAPVFKKLVKNNLGATLITWAIGVLFMAAGILLSAQDNIFLTSAVIVFWLAVFPFIFIKTFEFSEKKIRNRVLRAVQKTLAT